MHCGKSSRSKYNWSRKKEAALHASHCPHSATAYYCSSGLGHNCSSVIAERLWLNNLWWPACKTMWTAVMPQSRCPPSAVLISVGLCAEWVVLFSCAHLCSDISFVTQVLLQTVDMHSLTVQECVYYRFASGAEAVFWPLYHSRGRGVQT